MYTSRKTLKDSLIIERKGLDDLIRLIDSDDHFVASLDQACDRLLKASGRIVVTGIGKSGHVARKSASTLASTGTPAFYIHPSEAAHGDLGMIRPGDCVLAMSWSGETAELETIIRFCQKERLALIGLTSRADSILAREAEIAIILPDVQEACPNGLAPTTSALIQMALVDALAVELLTRRQFSAVDFRRFHPGGALGARLGQVSDVMRKGGDIPVVQSGVSIAESIVVMSEGAAGSLGIVDAEHRLLGILTDGDLRRHLSELSEGGGLKRPVDTVMTPSPLTVSPESMVFETISRMDKQGVNAYFVLDKDGAVAGLVTLRDLLVFSRKSR